MRVVLRAVVSRSSGGGGLFKASPTRYSGDHGELVCESVYSTGDVTVRVVALLAAENQDEARVLARYAEVWEVPSPILLVMQTVSASLAEAARRLSPTSSPPLGADPTM